MIKKGGSESTEPFDIEKLESLYPPDKPEYSPSLMKSLKCLDGRIKDPDGIYGFPGGDLGVFILVLSQYETILKKELTPSDIKR